MRIQFKIENEDTYDIWATLAVDYSVLLRKKQLTLNNIM